VLDFSQEFEVLAEADLFSTNQWLEIYRQLEPFGNANPRPSLWLSKATLMEEPRVLTRRVDGKPWAVSGVFQGPNGGRLRLTWKNLDEAQAMWQVGKDFRLVVSFSRTSSRGQTYDNWDILHCEPLAVTGLTLN